MTSSWNGLPSVDEPSNISIEIRMDPSPTTLPALVVEDAVGLSHQNLTSHDQERSDPSSFVPEERIKSWIQDIPSNEGLSTWEPTAAKSETEDEEEADNRRTKLDSGASANRLKQLMRQDSNDDPYQSAKMSTKGRYMPIPYNDPTVSKPSLDVIARKLSLHNAKKPDGRATGTGKQQSLLEMVKRRRSSLPASADSYVQLMGARSKSRAGQVPSALSITTAVSGTALQNSASTSESSKATKKVVDKGNLNFRVLAKLRMMTKGVDKTADAINKFATDPTHLKYIKDTAEMVEITIPVPIQISIYMKVLPILHDTCKTYNSELGPKHPLTTQALDKQELFRNHLESMMKTMG